MQGKSRFWPCFSSSVKWDQEGDTEKTQRAFRSGRKMLHACGIGETGLCEKRRVLPPEGRFLRAAHSGQRKAAGRPQQLALLQAGGQEAATLLCNEHNSNTASAHS